MNKDNIFIERDDSLYVKDGLKPGKINMMFTSRNGGVSRSEFATLNMAYHVGDDPERVRKNREIVANKLKIEINEFVFAEQVHGTNSYKVERKDIGRGVNSFEDGIPKTDCLYTYESGINLACFYADCIPIYFYEEKSGIIGIIHAGWQGTVKLILRDVLNKLKDVENIDLGNLHIVIGPSIKKHSFEVDADVQELFSAHDDLDLTKVISTKGDKYLIDTVEFNRQIAEESGVKEENILITDLNTYDEGDLFSFRRDGQTGRMIAVISKN